MTTRILLSTSDLRDILARHPDVEIDLLRSAVPQLAEMIRRKAVEKEPAVKKAVEEAFHHLMIEQGQKYGLSEAMRGVIRVYLADVWKVESKYLAETAAREAAKEEAQRIFGLEKVKAEREISSMEEAARARIDAYARDAAEREVLALLRAGKLQMIP